MLPLIATGALTFLIVVPLLAPPSAQAKTIHDYDEEISAQQAVVDEKDVAYDDALRKLTDMTKWCYKNTSIENIVQSVISGTSMKDAVDSVEYASRVYEQYASEADETRAAKEEAEAARDELVSLRNERIARSKSLENATKVQFPQGGGNEWSGLRYWGGNVGSSGCGLCAYTVAIDVLTGADYNPAQMLDIRGDWVGMDGYPDDSTGTKDGSSHHDWTLAKWDIETWNIDNTTSALAEALDNNESVAIVCSHGNSFKNKSGVWRSTDGHFICVVGHDESGFHVSDSAYSHDEGTDVVYNDADMSRMLSGANLVTIYAN